MNIKFFLKQYIKMATQSLLLPAVYRFYRRQAVDPRLVVFADGHHRARPENMRLLYETLSAREHGKGYIIKEMYLDYGNASARQIFQHMIAFMKWYAKAGTVIICDNFLPAAGCRKRKETLVIQLWHACGCLKRFGYDTAGDIPSNYRGNVFRNTDLVTVSSEKCRKPFASAMRLPVECVSGIGVSRTDRYFRDGWAQQASERFYREMPEAKGKKIVLFAPTFRGYAGAPRLVAPDLHKLQEDLGEEVLLLVRLHPHMKAALQTMTQNGSFHRSGIVFAPDRIATEDLFAVTDVLIADYSSLLFEYLAVGRELVLYVPDLSDYLQERGFYLDYKEIPGAITSSQEELVHAVQSALGETHSREERKNQRSCFLKQYMGACDGKSTERIAAMINQHVKSISDRAEQ